MSCQPPHQPLGELTLQLSLVSKFLGKTPSAKVPRTSPLVSFVNTISLEGLEGMHKHILCAQRNTRTHA